MNGFLTRADFTTKFAFGRHGVFGQEPNLEIWGVWLIKGKEIPEDLTKNHPQFEHYRTRKMDPRKQGNNDDKLIREMFSGKEDEVIGGMKAQALTWHK